MQYMDFGLIMTVAGMGVTFLVLYILILVIRLMDKIFPYIEPKEEE